MVQTSPLPPSKGEFAPFHTHSSMEERTDRLPFEGRQGGVLLSNIFFTNHF